MFIEFLSSCDREIFEEIKAQKNNTKKQQQKQQWSLVCIRLVYVMGGREEKGETGVGGGGEGQGTSTSAGTNAIIDFDIVILH